jgi:tRNA(Arg) A34 adenosine deaminase TadA
MCLGAIYWSRPRKLYFAASRNDAAMAGFDDAEIYHEIELPYSNRKLPTEQFAQSEAVALFEKWVTIESKIEY